MEVVMSFEKSAIAFRHYRLTDRQWVIDANVAHYERIEQFESSFAGAVSKALDLIEESLDDPKSSFLIAEVGEQSQPIGCVFFSSETSTTGRLRLFYLDEQYRGQGIGRRMVGELIEHALGCGFDAILVSTFDRHEAACNLYRKLGFKEFARKPAMAFGQQMHQIDFEKTLSDHAL